MPPGTFTHQLTGPHQERQLADPDQPGLRMGAFTCAGNAFYMVNAMRRRGRVDWNIVAGLGVAPRLALPAWHVWVRRGNDHSDPTWSLTDWWGDPGVEHYALADDLQLSFDMLAPQSDIPLADRCHLFGEAIEKHISKLAKNWGIETQL